MASLTIRNLPRELIDRIKAHARAEGRSMEQELRRLLSQHYQPQSEAEDSTSPARPTARCRRCGGQRLEPGSMQSTGKLYFRPANTKFLTLKTADVPIRANICLDCGAVELLGDVSKARALTDRKEPY